MEAKQSKEYFAGIVDTDQLAKAMNEKIRTYREWCASRGFTGLWKRKLINYYGMSENGNSSQIVSSGGSEGELALMKVNDFRTNLQNQLIIVTGNRPAGQAKAINSDPESIKASRAGTPLAEYLMIEKGFEQKLQNAAELALVCDEGYVYSEWDDSLGEKLVPSSVEVDSLFLNDSGPMEGADGGGLIPSPTPQIDTTENQEDEPMHEGDLTCRVIGPWYVARDPAINTDCAKWRIITFRENKFELIAKFPRFKEHILAVKKDDLPQIPFDNIPEGSDAVYCHLLIADRTTALPQGRKALMVGGKIIKEGALGDKHYPLKRMTPSDVIDSSMGYAQANDLLAMETVTDALHSIIATNEINLAGNSLVGPQGQNINWSEVAKGLRYFELPPDMVDKLKVLELCRTPAEVFNYLPMLFQKKDQTVGINSVTKGNPEGQLAGASGSAFALIQAQAISFNSKAQQAYLKLCSEVITSAVTLFAANAATKRKISIVGKHLAPGVKELELEGKDVEKVSSVVYEMVNPISQTWGGRMQLAKDLLDAGQIKSPKQYINMVMTGQIEVLTQDDEADGLIILEENEWLSEGKPFDAIITQIHADHIKSHSSQITPEKQMKDPDFVKRTLEHIMRHIQLWTEASMSNPAILFATGQQPLPMNPMMGQMGGAPMGVPGAMGAPGAPPPPSDKIEQEMSGSSITDAAEDVDMPNLPNIAGTKEQAVIPGVTGVA